MKRKLKIGSCIVALTLVGLVAWATIAGTTYYRIERENFLFLKKVNFASSASIENDGATVLDGEVTINGRAVIANAILTSSTLNFPAQSLTDSLTLDDGAGASPSFIMQDGTDQTATFSKVDAGYLTLTTDATDGLNILTGSLKVGNGSPGQTINGEDAYIEGLCEVDGALYADGGISVTTLATSGKTTFGAAAIVNTVSDVTVTSVSKAINVSAKNVICLNGYESVTGSTLTNGTKGQRVLIYMDSQNTNTVRFDDATSMSLGANITLKGQDNDTLELLCLSNGGTTWAKIGGNDN